QVESLAHETLAGARLERVVAQIRRMKMTAHDLADVDYTRNVIGGRDDQKAFAVFAPKTSYVSIERIAIVRWRYPTSMQLATTTHRAQEISAVTLRWPLEPYPLHHRVARITRCA